MLKPIRDLPDGVVGVEAFGRVDAGDYERVLAPAVEHALEKHTKIRFLYHLGQEFTGFTPAAMWDDAKVGLRHRKEFERCAVVTDAEWVRGAVGLFRVFMPCPVEVFSNSQLRQAKDWVNA